LEDLTKIKTKTSKTKEGFKRTKHNNAISQIPFFLFKERLTNKAQLVGKRVETVSPAYTSQTDSRTNKRDGIRQGCRYYCSDGVVLDADYNAAVNIALRANHPLSSSEPPLSGRVLSTTQSLKV
jgi:IS605 OrfB family transposase